MKTKILLVGLGNMGKMLANTLHRHEKYEIIAVIDNDPQYAREAIDNGAYIYQNLAQALTTNEPDVVVDFTSPKCVFENAKEYLAMRIPAVIGTTGLKTEELETLAEISIKQKSPIFIAPNFSTGSLAAIRSCCAIAVLMPDAEICIDEYHHKKKVDWPSGTAVEFAKQMILDRCKQPNPPFNYGELQLEKAADHLAYFGNIRINSYRQDGVNARQVVTFSSPGQQVVITHDAPDRACYWAGIEKGILWVLSRKEEEYRTFAYGLGSII